MPPPYGLPGAPRPPEDLALSYPGVNAVLLHRPNICLGPIRACALLARNYDPWQHRSPLHEMRFVLGSLLGTNRRRDLLMKILLTWRARCSGNQERAGRKGQGWDGEPDRGGCTGLLHVTNLSLGPVQACALLARNQRLGQHRSPVHEQRSILGALLGTNVRRELLGRILLSWLLLSARRGDMQAPRRIDKDPSWAPRRVRDRRCYEERDGGTCLRPGCPFLHVRGHSASSLVAAGALTPGAAAHVTAGQESGGPSGM